MRGYIEVAVFKMCASLMLGSRLVSDENKTINSVQVYLSEGLSDNEMVTAQNILKPITEKTYNGVILDSDGPCIDADDPKIFSRILSVQAVKLLSEAMPHHEFFVASNFKDLKLHTH